MRYAIVIAIVGIVLLAPVATADEVADVERTWERPFEPGAFLRVENLVGSMTVDGASEPGIVRVRARVVAEGATWDEATALASTVDLAIEDTARGPVVRTTWPTDRHPAFRPPRAEDAGFMSRMTSWISPIVRKRTIAADWGGRSVEVGDIRGAPAIAVHLHVSLPLDSVTEFRQVLGTLDVARLRGETTLEIVAGDVSAAQLYGRLSVRTGGGQVAVKNFKGEALDVLTSSGDIEVVDVHADHVTLTASSGWVRGNTVDAELLSIESGAGDVELQGIEPRALDIRAPDGAVDIATRFKRTRQATISSGGDVTLRVGEFTPFDLVAETAKGDVKARGVKMDVVERDNDGPTHLRRGSGGIDVVVRAERGSITVRPIR